MIETKKLHIKGMYCAACAVRIEKAVSKLSGVKSIHVNLATEQGRVTYDRNLTALSFILERMNKIGFEAKEASEERGLLHPEDDILRLQWTFIAAVLLTIPLAWAMISHFQWLSALYIPSLFLHPLFQLVVTIPIQFIIGIPFYQRAWTALKNRSANMDVLVVLSTSAAFFYSHYLTMVSFRTQAPLHPSELFYETSAFIITFILLGKLLEAKTKRKTTAAIKSLYELQTKTAILYEDGEQKIVQVNDLKKGDQIFIKPGEKVPIDGQVISGESTVDESLLTGESRPIEKKRGHTLFAGTINQYGPLIMTVTATNNETALAHIIRVVEEAQAGKAPIQKTVDKLTEFFVPFVIVVGLVAFALSYFYFQAGDEYEALKRLIAVLIIACPCALGLATPTSITVGSGRAAQLGILFKDGKFLETLGKSTVAIFDKTGTVTKGEPSVTDLYVENEDRGAFLGMIGAVEQASSHPVGKAILNVVKKELISLPMAKEVVVMPGYGITGKVGKTTVLVANPAYFRKQARSIPLKALKIIHSLEQQGKTVMIAEVGSRFAGVIAVSDEVKPNAKGAIARIKKIGMNVMMLSGDHQLIAKSVANELGINTCQAEMTPQEKVACIEQLKKNGHRVVMIGDGINDAPALAVADIGMGLGTGADIAIDSSDVTLMTGNVQRIADAFIISRKTIANIKQNLLWAFFYNMMMIPFAAIGLLAPSFAGAAMALSSITVVLNALRLKRVKVG